MFRGEPPGKGHGRVLLRVFCHAYRDKVVLLLNGYARQARQRRGRRE